MSIHFLSYDLSWRNFDKITLTCTIIICIESLIMICLIVSRRCEAILMTGDDCGVGIG